MSKKILDSQNILVASRLNCVCEIYAKIKYSQFIWEHQQSITHHIQSQTTVTTAKSTFKYGSCPNLYRTTHITSLVYQHATTTHTNGLKIQTYRLIDSWLRYQLQLFHMGAAQHQESVYFEPLNEQHVSAQTLLWIALEFTYKHKRSLLPLSFTTGISVNTQGDKTHTQYNNKRVASGRLDGRLLLWVYGNWK